MRVDSPPHFRAFDDTRSSQQVHTRFTENSIVSPISIWGRTEYPSLLTERRLLGRRLMLAVAEIWDVIQHVVYQQKSFDIDIPCKRKEGV